MKLTFVVWVLSVLVLKDEAPDIDVGNLDIRERRPAWHLDGLLCDERSLTFRLLRKIYGKVARNAEKTNGWTGECRKERSSLQLDTVLGPQAGRQSRRRARIVIRLAMGLASV